MPWDSAQNSSFLSFFHREMSVGVRSGCRTLSTDCARGMFFFSSSSSSLSKSHLALTVNLRLLWVGRQSKGNASSSHFVWHDLLRLKWRPNAGPSQNKCLHEGHVKPKKEGQTDITKKGNKKVVLWVKRKKEKSGTHTRTQRNQRKSQRVRIICNLIIMT